MSEQGDGVFVLLPPEELYDKARGLGRDVRVQQYEERDFESLLAFPRWMQAVKPDVEAAGDRGAVTLKAFVSRLSEKLLRWIDSWRQTSVGGAG